MSKSCCEFSQIFDLQGQGGKKRSAQTIPGRYSRRIGDRHVRAKLTGGAGGAEAIGMRAAGLEPCGTDRNWDWADLR